jgi:hypothetical protein
VYSAAILYRLYQHNDKQGQLTLAGGLGADMSSSSTVS